MQLVREHRIDVVLQLAPISPKMLSSICGPDAPVGICPLSGGLEMPLAFQHIDGRLVSGLIRASRALATLMHRAIPSELQAPALLVGNQRTAAALPRGRKAAVMKWSRAVLTSIAGRPRNIRLLMGLGRCDLSFAADWSTGGARSTSSRHSSLSPGGAATCISTST